MIANPCASTARTTAAAKAKRTGTNPIKPGRSSAGVSTRPRSDGAKVEPRPVVLKQIEIKSLLHHYKTEAVLSETDRSLALAWIAEQSRSQRAATYTRSGASSKKKFALAGKTPGDQPTAP